MEQDSKSYFVDDPKITEVIDTVNEVILPVKEVTNWNNETHSYSTRMEACISYHEYVKDKRLKPRFICGRCEQPVYLVSSVNKKFFFRHADTDGNCVKTRGEPYKPYAGVRPHGESELHKVVKGYVRKSLEADGRFENVLVERGLKDPDTGERKVPDVSAWLGDKGIAFEVQVSNESFHNIFKRGIFYRDLTSENREWLICWVFDKSFLEEKFIILDDIRHWNNRNLLTVDIETVTLSEKEKRFYLKCHWEEPMIDGAIIKNEKVVAFDELTLDFVKHRIFLFDFEDAKERLEKGRLERLELERLEKERQKKERLERLEKERQEQLERERLKRLEKERLEKEQLEREQQKRLEREQLEREWLEKEQQKWLERERLERERLEREQLRQWLVEEKGKIRKNILDMETTLTNLSTMRKMIACSMAEHDDLVKRALVLVGITDEYIHGLANERHKIANEIRDIGRGHKKPDYLKDLIKLRRLLIESREKG